MSCHLFHAIVRRDLGMVDDVVQRPLLGFVFTGDLLLHRSQHSLYRGRRLRSQHVKLSPSTLRAAAHKYVVASKVKYGYGMELTHVFCENAMIR